MIKLLSHTRPLSCGALLAAVCMLTNCCYVLKQGTYIFKYSSEAVPMKKLAKRSDTPPECKQFLSLVLQIKQFAADSIGLVKNSNFTNYVKIGKKYLVDVVYAAGKDDFTPYEWRFIFFGSFPYKGFFEQADAKKEADRLAARGYDVCIGQVDAFSTLGFFSDPVYSFMQDFPVYRLANLIIHEQTHATLFIKNQIQFNEQLASFVADRGALWFIKMRYGDSSSQYKAGLAASHDIAAYYRSIRSLYQTLSSVYESNISRDEKLLKKQQIIAAFKDSISRNYDSLFETDSFKGLQKAAVNNAFISADIIYTYDLGLFYELYNKKNRDLAATMASLMTLKKTKGDCLIALKRLVER